jgi:CDP-diacylglycerol--serine O-phosphatidyltransferase
MFFIGYYNLANAVTLLGLVSALAACIVAIDAKCSVEFDKNQIIFAVALFLVSGLCDMFDGRIARGYGSRTRKEKLFGIQIDSLCDMVSFGIAPVIIAYCAGFDEVYHLIAYVVYSVCGAIRLAYFNTQAVEETKDLNMKCFTGVPIPVCCLTVPPMMLLFKIFGSANLFVTIFFALMYFMTGIAFIINVKIKKLSIVQSLLIVAGVLTCVVFLFLI